MQSVSSFVISFVLLLILRGILSYNVLSNLNELNDTIHSQWYGSCDSCILKNIKEFQSIKKSDHMLHCELHCRNTTNKLVQYQYSSLTMEYILSDDFMYHGNLIYPYHYDMIRKGYENYFRQYPLISIFIMLSKMMIHDIYFIGDSITINLYFRMMDELGRSNITLRKINAKELYSIYNTSTNYTDAFVVNLNQHSITKHLPRGESLKIDFIRLHLFYRYDHFMDIGDFINSTCHHHRSPIVVIFNVGLHFAMREYSGQNKFYRESFYRDLIYVYEAVLKHHSESLFFFRETLPSFFDAENGDYMLYVKSPNNSFGVIAPPGQYPCRPILSYTYPVYENKS